MSDVKALKINIPWDPVQVPEYRLFNLGKWKLRRTPLVGRPAVGYWFPVPALEAGYALQKKTRGHWDTWMSITPMEMQSHQPHIAAAEGNVIVGGLGMGLYLFNILAKPEVKRVLVCEIEPEVIDLFDRITNWRAWPGAEKLEIRECDVRKLKLQPGADFCVDYLYVDIWPTLGNDVAHLEVQTMVANIRPKMVSYWGQEFDFATFLLQNKLPFDKRTSLEHWAMFREVTGLLLAGGEWDLYPRFAGAAVIWHAMGNKRLSDVEKQKCYMQALAMLGALDGLGAPTVKGDLPADGVGAGQPGRGI